MVSFVGDINNGNLYFFKVNQNRAGLGSRGFRIWWLTITTRLKQSHLAPASQAI